MKHALLALSLAAILPMTACASQSATNSDSAGTTQVAADATTGPSADARAAMAKARNDAKTAALAALSADHRAKVQAIVDQFNSGTSVDVVAPPKAIDAILTSSEAKAVLAQEATMRASMPARTGTGGPGGYGSRKRTPDAGRFLFQAMASRDRLRAARQAASN